MPIFVLVQRIQMFLRVCLNNILASYNFYFKNKFKFFIIDGSLLK